MRDTASKNKVGAEEMAQQLRIIGALTIVNVDLGSIASTHKVAHNYPNSSSRESDILF